MHWHLLLKPHQQRPHSRNLTHEKTLQDVALLMDRKRHCLVRPQPPLLVLMKVAWLSGKSFRQCCCLKTSANTSTSKGWDKLYTTLEWSCYFVTNTTASVRSVKDCNKSYYWAQGKYYSCMGSTKGPCFACDKLLLLSKCLYRTWINT